MHIHSDQVQGLLRKLGDCLEMGLTQQLQGVERAEELENITFAHFCQQLQLDGVPGVLQQFSGTILGWRRGISPLITYMSKIGSCRAYQPAVAKFKEFVTSVLQGNFPAVRYLPGTKREEERNNGRRNEADEREEKDGDGGIESVTARWAPK